MIYVGHVIYLA